MEWQGKSYNFWLDFAKYSVNLEQRWTEYQTWFDFEGKWYNSENYYSSSEIFKDINDPCYEFLWWKLEREGQVNFSPPYQPFPSPQPQPQPVVGWQCNKVTYIGFKQLSNQVTMTGPFGPSIGYGMQFSPDGSKLYVQDYAWFDGYIYCFDLSTPWDIMTAVYKNKYHIAAAERQIWGFLLHPGGMFFSPDGLNFYLSAESGTPAFIAQFPLLKAWDITTINFASYKKFNNICYHDFVIDPTGTILYGVLGDYCVYKHTLSTPWDITTITNTTGIKCVEVPHDGVYEQSIYFKPDGTALYVTGGYNIYYYTLSTPWDLTSNNYQGVCFNIEDTLRKAGVTHGSWFTNLRFSPDGMFCYVTYRDDNAKVYKFTLTG